MNQQAENHLFITRICITNVASGLRRLPANFYVAVEIDGKTTETESKPALVNEDTMEWDQEILLSSEQSSIISFKVYAAFELGLRLGNGELLRQFKVTLGDLLDRDANDQHVKFSTQKDEVFPSCSSVRIATSRRVCAVGKLTDAPKPSELGQLTDTAHHALSRFHQYQDQTDLDKAIVCFERARDTCPHSHPNYSTVLFNLANAKFVHCQINDCYLDLDEPISLYRDAVKLRATDHPDYPTAALDLCFALLVRYQRRGDEADKIESRELLSKALELFPAGSYGYRAACLALQMAEISASTVPEEDDDIDTDSEQFIQEARFVLMHLSIHDRRRPAVLATLGNSMYRRFERDGNLVDIHEAIWLLQEAVELTVDEHPDKPALLSTLGSSLGRRFERLGDTKDIDRSISTFGRAIELAPDHYPEKSYWLSNLGTSLLHRFERLGNLADVERSVFVSQEAIRLVPDNNPGKPTLLVSLSTSLFRRFECLGNSTDIDQSILIAEEAVRLAPNHYPEKQVQLANLGASLSRRFERLGAVADIDRSISMFERAICVAPDGHPGKPTALNNLGNALTLRFVRLGDLADINKAISMRELAALLTPDGHPHKLSLLNNLGNSLMTRFEHLDDLADVNRSISMFEQAVCLIPDASPERPTVLTSLGRALFCRFERAGDLADIDKSVLVQEEAARLSSDDNISKPVILSNLGSSLFSRFDKLGCPVDIDKSIFTFEKAISLTRDGDPKEPVRLSNLGSSLARRWQAFGKLADINKSISTFKEVIGLTPKDDITQLARLYNLGVAFVLRFEESSDPSDLSEAALCFSTAARASIGPISTRFLSSRYWIASATLQNDSQALLDAYGSTIDLLPQLAWLGLPLSERHRVLSDAAHVARDAAAAALEAGFPEMAVEWLEQGRSIVWSQFLELRTPVDELRVQHPELANRFQHVSQELERASFRHGVVSSLGLMSDDFMSAGLGAIFRAGLFDTAGSYRSLEEQVQRQHNLALVREKLLEEIRSLPCFDRFLLPKTIEQLGPSVHTGSGPVVYLNASKQQCDALIVVPDEQNVSVIPVSLSAVRYRDVEEIQRLLHLSLMHHQLILSRRDVVATRKNEEFSLQRLLEILSVDGERAARIKPRQTAVYSIEDLIQSILEYLWINVVYPVLEALGFSTPSSPETRVRIFWCPTGPFASLPIHAAGLYGTTKAGTKLSDFVISSYIPSLSSLGSLTQGNGNTSPSHIRLVAVPQPPTDRLGVLVSVEEEINHIRTISATSPYVFLQESHGTIEDVLEKMKTADWVHFACHGVQDPLDPLSSGVCLADGRRLKLSDIIKLSRRTGGLAFLSACQTAQGDEKLSEESVHLAAGMLLAGYGSVVATMWAIQDVDGPRVTKEVYARLFKDGRKVPDTANTAEALDYAVRHLRDTGASFASWVPFIHVGR